MYLAHHELESVNIIIISIIIIVCTAGPFLMEKEEDRVLLVKAVLHAADISNPVRPFHVNCVMSTSVHREFR